MLKTLTLHYQTPNWHVCADEDQAWLLATETTPSGMEILYSTRLPVGHELLQNLSVLSVNLWARVWDSLLDITPPPFAGTTEHKNTKTRTFRRDIAPLQLSKELRILVIR